MHYNVNTIIGSKGDFIDMCGENVLPRFMRGRSTPSSVLRRRVRTPINVGQDLSTHRTSWRKTKQTITSIKYLNYSMLSFFFWGK